MYLWSRGTILLDQREIHAPSRGIGVGALRERRESVTGATMGLICNSVWESIIAGCFCRRLLHERKTMKQPRQWVHGFFC